jgi:hypothetical protein
MKQETEPVTADVISISEWRPSFGTMVKAVASFALAVFVIGATFVAFGFRAGYPLLSLWMLGVATGRWMPHESVLREYAASSKTRSG